MDAQDGQGWGGERDGIFPRALYEPPASRFARRVPLLPAQKGGGVGDPQGSPAGGLACCVPLVPSIFASRLWMDVPSAEVLDFAGMT